MARDLARSRARGAREARGRPHASQGQAAEEGQGHRGCSVIVEVTAQLDGPVMADQHVHLDGLLLWSAAQDLGLPVPLRGTALADLPEITIPVEAETRAGLTIYLSSAWVLPDDVGAYRHDWTRRRD